MIFFWATSVILKAQDNFAVINDLEGFANIHEGNLQSKVRKAISNYQPFDCIDDKEGDHQLYPNMVYIEYDNYIEHVKDHYFYSNPIDNSPRIGYIHKSRICRLNDMRKLKPISISKSQAVYGGIGFKVVIEIGDFESSKHIIKDSKGRIITDKKNYDVATIDEKPIWGTDGTIPYSEIRSIKVIYSDKTVSLPASSLKNNFLPNISPKFTYICIGPQKEIYIWMSNGDGAASYNIIWVMVDQKLKYVFRRLSWYV